MDFCIQASNPRFTGSRDEEAGSLDEALESAFPLQSERAILFWKQIPIPLSYKYDISIMAADIITMLSKIINDPTGTFRVAWASNTFRVDWNMHWDEAILAIDPQWDAVHGGFDPRLPNSGGIRIPKVEFISEWKEVLLRTAQALHQSGYDDHQIDGLGELGRLIDQIDFSGIPYR